MLNIIVTAFLLLLIGDFLATFFYHIPEHVFGKYHNLVHHSSNRSFIYYAIVAKRPQALISGFLAFAPYLLLSSLLWQISPYGVIFGLILAEIHVIWRHSYEGQPKTSKATPKTPFTIANLCQKLYITTPERHLLHHENTMNAYGDVFTFYDRPAQAWLQFLKFLNKEITVNN